jgi:hypothetical protein
MQTDGEQEDKAGRDRNLSEPLEAEQSHGVQQLRRTEHAIALVPIDRSVLRDG